MVLNWSNRIFRIFVLVASMAIILVISVLIIQDRVAYSDQLLEEAKEQVKKDRLGVATELLERTRRLSKKNEMKASELLKEIKDFQSDAHLSQILTKLNNNEFRNLQNRNYQGYFFRNDSLNERFKVKLINGEKYRKELLTKYEYVPPKASKKVNYKKYQNNFEDIIVNRKKREMQEIIYKELEDKKENLEDQFDPLDGDHIKLRNLIKQNMDDPDSYEHVKTEYKLLKDYQLYVITTYRERNSYNAKILRQIEGIYYVNGSLKTARIIR